ncbi:MAG: hypothetical protein ACREE7_09135, partial [Dongiaceae bacterium]
MKRLALGAFAWLALAAGAAAQPVINEFVANHVGIDTNEYAEGFATPFADLSAYSIIEIEGEGTTARGLVDDFIQNLTAADANGIWWSGFTNNLLENGTLMLLLVSDLTAVTPNVSDIDTNDDGVIDTTFWSEIVDSVAVFDGGAGELTYSSVVLDMSLPPAGFPPGGASRIPNGTDTDSVSDWRRNDFDGAGIPGFTG